ncbi:hypothetical protein OOZ54_13135 [Rhodopseudomonas palustris]|uniref:hypothetical protein n=1 Tax=Rhodopseudomonas palustris TaxID=1076 RepID=UPI0022F105D7|nr:hypothetical protein [Rhodopseudomonas palustris]WBU27617.1 hypothetical protein OOZ54_13135 [Rhodopseudomonas palustris]
MADYWTGSQWKVTPAGVTTLDNRYLIEKDRVHEEDVPGYTWEQHMAEKTWVDLEDFKRAMAIARKRWPKP